MQPTKFQFLTVVILLTSVATAQTNNKLYSWGDNSTSQLGLGNDLNHSIPQLVGNNFKCAAAGYDFSLFINQKGELFASGANGHGQCGDSDYRDHTIPQKIGKDTNWKFVTAGWNHALGINSKGELYGWGSNADFEAGVGVDTIYNVFVPRKIGNDSNWISASGGSYFSLAINSKGELYSWGGYNDGTLGLGNVFQNQNVPKRVGTDSNWVKVVTGRNFSIALNSKGQIFSFGNNRYGQLGLGNLINQNTPQRVGNDSNFTDVAAGWYHVLAVKSNGELYSWGRNKVGQLGIGNKIDQTIPVRVGVNSNWKSVATGSAHSLAMTKNGKLFSFGDNSFGQLGVGLTKDQTIPNRIDNDSNCTFVASGTAHCLAILNDVGQSAGINDGSEITERFSGIQVYPNPTNDLLHLEFNDRISTAQYSIYSISGNKIQEGVLGESNSIHVSNFISGVYFIRIGNKFAKFVKD
jgi:alpha-tubulin suppressor-like RCC1 family protein